MRGVCQKGGGGHGGQAAEHGGDGVAAQGCHQQQPHRVEGRAKEVQEPVLRARAARQASRRDIRSARAARPPSRPPGQAASRRQHAGSMAPVTQPQRRAGFPQVMQVPAAPRHSGGAAGRQGGGGGVGAGARLQVDASDADATPRHSGGAWAARGGWGGGAPAGRCWCPCAS